MIDACGRKITYLRLSVTDLCDLRCRYCMPEAGVCKKPHEEILTEEEMLTAVKAAAQLGVTKLRITGGEPLVKSNILSICEKAATIPGIGELCITTNGTRLPEYALHLKSVGVNHVNISLDTLDPEKYSYITRRGSLSVAWRGIESALAAGFNKVKLNAVLIGGFNDMEIPALARLTQKYPVDMRFIELMPMYDSGDFSAGAYISCDTVIDRLPELEPIKQDGGVARLFRLPGALGNVGLISPVSEHFCSRCNRIRLTADGKLKPCLHSGLEFSIKGLSLEGMIEQFKKAILAKPAQHGELSCEKRSCAGRNMNEIGG